MKRLGLVVGGAIALAVVILPELYQAAGKDMPDSLFWGSWAVLVGTVAVGGPVWLYVWAIHPAWRFLRSRHYRWPVLDPKKPDPNQWLHDLAQRHKDHPASYLIVEHQLLSSWKLEAKRPHVVLEVVARNCGLHTILIGGPAGHPSFNGDELRDSVESDDGTTRVGHWDGVRLRFRVFVDQETAGKLHAELERQGKIMSIGLSKVYIEVRADYDDCDWVKTRIPGNDIFRPAD